MFSLILDAIDRELINEIANREPVLDAVRDAMMADNHGGWMGQDTEVFKITLHNLERYLQYVHGVYVTEA